MGNIRIFRFASAFPGALVHERGTKSEEQEAVVANMELAISLAQPAALARIGNGPEAREAYWRERHGDPYLAAWLARFTPTHFYQGSEFCEHLLPSPHALKTGLQRARECRMRFCLLTPVASPQVIRNLALLLPLLPADAEVVANDGSPQMAEAALDAAETARYRPRLSEGKPLETADVKFAQIYFEPIPAATPEALGTSEQAGGA